MAQDQKSWPWILGMIILAAIPVGSVFFKQARKGARAAPATQRTTIRCAAISPGVFTVEPGGKRQLTAHFAGRGQLAFAWSANGGVITTFNGVPGQPTLAGYAYLDDFDDGIIDEQLWSPEVPAGATLSERGGGLRSSIPSGSNDVVTRLETKPELIGDFGVQLTIRRVSATGNRGSAALRLVTADGHDAHVQALAGPGFMAVEANARDAEGRWQASASAAHHGGVMAVRLVRIGSTVTCDYDTGGGYVSLGQFNHVSTAPGRLRLETWSVDDHPSVEAEFDNFGAARNTIVVWQAPGDATPGSSFAVKVADGCEATALIAKTEARD